MILIILPLRSALKFLYKEGGYKAGMVSYGGVAAVTRAADNPKADILNSK